MQSNTIIIAFSGTAYAGKNTAADIAESILRREIPIVDVRKYAFADPIKAHVKELFGFTDDQVNTELKDYPDHRYPRQTGFLTPREALQKYATAFGRSCFPSIWTSTLMNKIMVEKPDFALITDLRFINEFNAVDSNGGCTVCLKRFPPGGMDLATRMHGRQLDPGEGYIDVIAQKAEFLVDNTGDLEALADQLEDVLETFWRLYNEQSI